MTAAAPWAGATLTTPVAFGVAVLVVAYCVLGEPLVGRWLHRRMEQEITRDATRRWRGYARLLVLEAVLGAATLAVARVLGGIGLGRLGLSLPRLEGSRVLFGIGVGVSALVVAGVVASTIAIRRLRPPIPVVGGDHVRVMVPTRRGERVWFLVLAVAAGVCEELLYRGLLPALLAALLGGLGGISTGWPVVVLAALAFGAAHAYQGRTGVAVTALLGALLGGVYLATGSLPLVMLLHALIDARVGLLPAGALGESAAGAPA